MEAFKKNAPLYHSCNQHEEPFTNDVSGEVGRGVA